MATMKPLSRRAFLRLSSLAALGYATPWWGRACFAQSPSPQNKVLVVIFQRGAADGLAMVPPVSDPYFGRQVRPTLALPSNELISLNDDFSLHPALRPLLPLWQNKQMAIVHQVGSPHPTRSHFEAQDYMEAGTVGDKTVDSGFLGRAVETMASTPNDTLRAIALQSNLPRSLWGQANAFAMESIQSFTKLGQTNMTNMGMHQGFEQMYANALDQALRSTGENTFDAMKILSNLPSNDRAVNYPKGPLGRRLAGIARLIKGNVGLRVAVTDSGGWDTHKQQGAASGQLANRLNNMSQAIAAFVQDMGPQMQNVCLVTMTEFGRTVKENGSGGTDHGHGSVMFVIGDQVKGQNIAGDWVSLRPENLYQQRDLPVTNDFRRVWSEILHRHMGVQSQAIFPEFAPSSKKINLFS
jgi:uncharacterized protein (DUF1501 family)